MRITRMKTNRITNPLGFDLGKPHLSWVVEDTQALFQVAAQVQVALDESFSEILFDSGKQADIDSLAYEAPLKLEPCARYFWRVQVWGNNGESALSDPAWFETAKMGQPWQAEWITPDWDDQKMHPLLRKEFSLEAPVAKARLYACGLGVYELEINGQKVGDETLAPGFFAYDRWLQYQTYDVTAHLQEGANALGAMLGDGWYKGRFGFGDERHNVYGDRFALICELVVTFPDGKTMVIASDTSWKAAPSPVVASNIYDGEIWDARRQIQGWSSPGLEESDWSGVRPIDLGHERLQARRSLPVVVKEEIQPAAVIHTPAGETVLDMGQNMVGWLRFKVKAPKGREILLQHGEVLIGGNFFNENLRSAKAEYRYISDGEEAVVRAHFTFFGFRYVKISGWAGKVRLKDFSGCVAYSDMEPTGHLETSNPLVNRLFLNALWGQKGNFLDAPTDCPQRDERMGWTGDAQVFSGTACFNMDTAAFYNKFLYDLSREQETRQGMVPHVVPACTVEGGGACAWADAATIIPWNVYLYYGDKAILEQQFESMKAWVDYIRRADEGSGGKRLWTVGFHFGDWLALDGDDPHSPFGGTEVYFISSAFYCYSAGLVAKAAAELGKDEIAHEYQALAEEVKAAIQQEYFTPTGRLALNTQTALVLALFMDLAPHAQRGRVVEALRLRLKRDKNHLKTGFVGTPYLCRVLSENGCNDLAYTLLLHEDYPSWLYAVKLGATTIWERWNSIQPDGSIGDLGMNSLNHYAYGSIVEWMVRCMAGLNPSQALPGFRHAHLAPQPDGRLQWVKASLDSAAGRYECEWKVNKSGKLSYHFLIPFNCTATLVLPDAPLAKVRVNGKLLAKSHLDFRQEKDNILVALFPGRWHFEYPPTRAYRLRLSTHTPMKELLTHSEAVAAMMEILPPEIAQVDPEIIAQYGAASLRELAKMPNTGLTDQLLNQLDEKLMKLQLE